VIPLLSSLTVFAYFLATLKHILYLVYQRNSLLKIAIWTGIIGLVLHTVNLIIITRTIGHLPFANFSESLAFFSWVMVLAYILVELRYDIPSLGPFVMPLALLSISYSRLIPGEGTPLWPVVKNFWFLIHVIFAFLGIAAFALTFGIGIMYILQEGQVKSKRPGIFYYRLPSLEMLDSLGYKILAWGFPLLTMGLLAGSIWAQSAKGSFWKWDPWKSWPLLIGWLIYGILFIGRVKGWWRGRKAARWSVLGFVVVALSYLLHTY
jgi:cytochrome c-type biogenesis protein CcsB